MMAGTFGRAAPCDRGLTDGKQCGFDAPSRWPLLRLLNVLKVEGTMPIHYQVSPCSLRVDRWAAIRLLQPDLLPSDPPASSL